jgi:hypothetical protein
VTMLLGGSKECNDFGDFDLVGLGLGASSSKREIGWRKAGDG